MKILFINISDIRGGSSIVAYRLAKYLENNYETQNLLLVRSKLTNDTNVVQTRKNKYEDIIEWATNIIFNVLGLQYKYLPFSPQRIITAAREFKPDIINLHNPIGGYFRIKDLMQLSNIAPIVWTLHDMWAMTGNAAHTFGNEQWKQLRVGPGESKIFPWIGINTGTKLLHEKKKIYSKSDIRIVVPSNWMYLNAKATPVFKGKKIDLIHHGINLEEFKPIDKIKARKNLNISFDQKIISYSAEKLTHNPFKGGKELIEIIQKLDKLLYSKVVLLGIGKGKLVINTKLENIEIKNLGYISDYKRLTTCYAASDVFIYPTKADSFGLVLLEAIACGTPSVCFDIGGCGDIIKEGISGFLIPPFNSSEFANKVNLLLNNSQLLNELKLSCRKYAEEEFSLEQMATKYYNVFVEEMH